MSRILIGIDPGVETGVAVMEGGDLQAVGTFSFWGAVEELKRLKFATIAEGYSLSVYIEAPQLNAPTFNRGQSSKKDRKISQNVGENKAHSKLLIEYCERHGIDVVAVRPQKGPLTKMKADFFKQLTGWPGRTSQHGRDAVSMIWGR